MQNLLMTMAFVAAAGLFGVRRFLGAFVGIVFYFGSIHQSIDRILVGIDLTAGILARFVAVIWVIIFGAAFFHVGIAGAGAGAAGAQAGERKCKQNRERAGSQKI